MKWGIASRLSVISSALVLVATATVGYMVYRGARDSLVAASAERLRHTSDVIEVRLVGELEAIRRDLRFVGAAPPVVGMARTRSAVLNGFRLDPQTALTQREWRVQVESLFRSFLQNRPEYLDIALVSSEEGGRELMRVVKRGAPPVALPRDSLRVLPADSFFAQAWKAAAGETHLSPVQWGRWPGIEEIDFPLLKATVGVPAPGRDYMYLVALTVDMSEPLRSLEPVREEGRSVYVADAQGRLLIHQESSEDQYVVSGRPHLLQQEFPAIEPLLRSRAPEEVESAEVGEDAELLSYFKRILVDRGGVREPFVIGVTTPASSFLNNVHEVRARSLWITLLFCLGGVVLTLGLSQYLTRPLSRITAALSNLGEGSPDTKLPVGRSDEIGILARTFEVMEAQINRALQELEEKEHRQRIILETAAEAIIVADAEGRVETCNRAAERLFGYPADDLIGMNVDTLLTWREGGTVIEEISSPVLPAEDTGEIREGRALRRDGTTVPLSLAISSFEIGADRKYAGFMQDITERKTYEAMLREAKERAEEMARLKSAFLANMSHEIRTPLTSVLGYASLLAREVDPKHKRFAETIIQSGRRLMDTLNSVLALAQLEAGRTRIELRPLKVAAEVRGVVESFQSVAAEKGLSLRAFVAPEARDVEVALDRGAFSSILQNLIGNALKFTDQGGVDVYLLTSGERLFAEVRDTGIGIEATFLPHLFDEFRQESTGLGRSHEGTGLGLAITKRLTHLMGGALSVESRKGIGSTFSVSFPLLPEHQAAGPVAPAATRAEVRPLRKGLRMLLVEDNADTAHLIAELLEEVGPVVHVESAKGAVEAAGQERFDMVLMDINLGKGGKGSDALREIRLLPGYANVPIVAMTAYALPGDERRFLDMGFSGYLGKPFAVEDLLGTISRYSVERAAGELASA